MTRREQLLVAYLAALTLAVGVLFFLFFMRQQPDVATNITPAPRPVATAPRLSTPTASP